MKISLRMQAILLILLATLLLVNCSGGAPGCPQVQFGSSTCNPGQTGFGSGGGSGGSGGGGGGGGNNNTPTAFAYAVDENGTVDGYNFSSTGSSFTTISGYSAPVIPANLGGVGAVVAQGKFLYVVLQDAQQIYGYSIGSTGSLTLLSGFPLSVSLTGIADTTYNQQVVITNPAGTLLFISEFGTEEILAFQISSSGALTQVNGSPFSTLPAGIEPQNMAMDGLGRFLYVAEDSIDHSGSIIVIYSVSSGGALTLASGTFVNDPLWEMAGDPSGNYLVGISGKTMSIYGQDDDHLYVYSINSTTGALTAVSNSPFATQYAPFNITMDPSSANGEYIYSFSINDSGTGANPIEAYSLNTSTGALTAVSGSPFSNLTVSPWGQFDQSGGYLFVYAGVSPDFSLGVMSVGSTGGLTETVGTVPLTTGGYWAVTDVP
jgi:6-phosphogluconolactonase